mmetsp:Transcript_3107/g.4555  ORF Transcript_3107/g.4555 Transcript_3107/m.4555 type:complete len:210 (+) Transcript_3107:354-983(+)
MGSCVKFTIGSNKTVLLMSCLFQQKPTWCPIAHCALLMHLSLLFLVFLHFHVSLLLPKRSNITSTKKRDLCFAPNKSILRHSLLTRMASRQNSILINLWRMNTFLLVNVVFIDVKVVLSLQDFVALSFLSKEIWQKCCLTLLSLLQHLFMIESRPNVVQSYHLMLSFMYLNWCLTMLPMQHQQYLVQNQLVARETRKISLDKQRIDLRH